MLLHLELRPVSSNFGRERRLGQTWSIKGGVSSSLEYSGVLYFCRNIFWGEFHWGWGSDGFMVRYITGGPNKEGRPEGGGPVHSGVGGPPAIVPTPRV